MIVRVIIQKNMAGEKHVTLTQDQVISTEELLIDSPGWEDYKVIEGRVLLLGMDEPDVVIDDLVDAELHTAWTQHSRIAVSPALLKQLVGD